MNSIEKLLCHRVLCFCLPGLLLWSVASAAQVSTESRIPQPAHTFTLTDMDRSVQPGDDFFLYSNGGWLKRTVIPPDRASVSVFSALDQLSNRRLAALISPGRYRTDTVRNSDVWYELFQVHAGKKLYLDPKDRVRIW